MRSTWDETWYNVAFAVSQRSPCTRTKVGAVIVDSTNRIVATGYNGMPAPFETGPTCETTCPRTVTGSPDPYYSDCFSIHAEANALLFCDRRDRVGGTLYVTSAMCWNCAKLVANSGLVRVVSFPAQEHQMHRFPEASMKLLKDCGIRVDVL